MQWFEYRQNNSGGSFETSDKVSHSVFIQAENAVKANEKAESIGIYFNGCEKGLDCDCCGDRWYPSYEGDAIDLEGMSFEEYLDKNHVNGRYNFFGNIYTVHYSDGRIIQVEGKKK